MWLGVSVEDRERMLERGADLAATPAAVRVWSAEPLLGDLGVIPGDIMPDQIIVGGESGRDARPMHPAWVRHLRDQCAASGSAFFFKQWGEHIAHPAPDARWNDGTPVAPELEPVSFERVGKKVAGRLLDGREYSEFPA